ncbi:MAG: hypothetical protein WCK35_24000 [Chloroflexota bacterium]
MKNQPTSFRDAELISAYLDNQLSKYDRVRIESRLKIEPDLSKLLGEITQTKLLIHKLQSRRVPHNFTLTLKTVGVKPPLPKFIPFFQLSSVLAGILFFFSLTANLSVPVLNNFQVAPAAPALGIYVNDSSINPSVMEAPAAPMSIAPAVQTVTPEMSFLQTEPMQGEVTPSADGDTLPLEAQRKMSPIEPLPVDEPYRQPIQLPIPAAILYGLLGLVVISAGSAYFLRVRADNRWYSTQAINPAKSGLVPAIFVIIAILVVIILVTGVYYLSNLTFYPPITEFPTNFEKKGYIHTGMQNVDVGETNSVGNNGNYPPLENQTIVLESWETSEYFTEIVSSEKI